MPKNIGVTLSYNGQNGQVPLYPKTIHDQVIGWDLGESYGPYQLVLPANKWEGNQQTIEMAEVNSNDILYCVKVLNGTVQEMIKQDEAYSLLDPYVGIESLDGQIRFTCISTSPSVDLTVQVNWFR